MAPKSTTTPATPSRRASTRLSIVPKKSDEDVDMAELSTALKRKRSTVAAPSTPGRSKARPRKSFIQNGAPVKEKKPAVEYNLPPVLEKGNPRTVFIFGSGEMGNFGLGTDELGEIARPRLHKWFTEAIEEGKLGVGPGSGIETIECGGLHTLCVDSAGKVWSWGVNDSASLGRVTAGVPDPENPGSVIDTEILETQPMLVQGLEEEGFRSVKVAAGDSISLALSVQGGVRAWGSFRSGEGLLGFSGSSSALQFQPIPLPSLANQTFSSIACGTDHVLALTTDGHVYVWGNGQQNQLGRRIIERRKINGLSPERLALRKIAVIGCGNYHSFAVNEAGEVYAWGLNSLRQTGVGEEENGWEDIVATPTVVASLSPTKHNGAKVIQISGGEHHTLFLFDNGEVWGCGRCDASQLGLADEHPAMIAVKARTEEEVQRIIAERIGTELEGQAAPAVDEYVPEPVQIYFPPPPTADEPAPALPKYPETASNFIVSISAGTRHNLAVSRDGNVYAWGYGNQCQLGLGNETETAAVPERVRSKALNDYKVLDASAGGQHCVLVAVKKAT